MITQSGLLAVLESGSLLAVMVVVVLCLWPAYRVDEFRQALFLIRDELFDFAASGGIPFDHPAYRFNERFYSVCASLYRLTCNLIRWKLHEEQEFSWAIKWETALNLVEDKDTKSTLLEYQGRMFAVVAKRLVTGSPILLAILFGLILSHIVQSQWVSLRELARDSAELMMTRIFDPRFLEEEASTSLIAPPSPHT